MESSREYASTGTEVPAKLVLNLNSLFIVSFCPSFSKWWESNDLRP
jgi:dipeptide/tripeptide permease